MFPDLFLELWSDDIIASRKINSHLIKCLIIQLFVADLHK